MATGVKSEVKQKLGRKAQMTVSDLAQLEKLVIKNSKSKEVTATNKTNLIFILTHLPNPDPVGLFFTLDLISAYTCTRMIIISCACITRMLPKILC